MTRLWNIFHSPRLENVAASAAPGDWQTALLGPETCKTPFGIHRRQQLIDGLLAGEPAAISLIGLLLILRTTTAEKTPTLLRDLGEAYYRWQPTSENRPRELEEFLATWLPQDLRKPETLHTMDLVWTGGILRVLGKEQASSHGGGNWKA